MLQFLKYVLATIVGIFLFTILFFFILAGIGSMFSSSDSAAKVKDRSILQLNFDSGFSELKAPEDPFTELLEIGSPSIGLNDLKSALANAALDPAIEGISIKLNEPSIGFAALEEVATALKDFKKSGKFIYTFSDYMSEQAVLIAAYADSVFIHPMGAAEFNGLSSEVMFYKGALDKVGIEPLVFRVGEFKSSVEPFIRKDMSEESKLQMNEYVNSIAKNIYTDYAKQKGISKEKVDDILNITSVFNSEEALENKLVSKIAYWDEYEQALRNRLDLKNDDTKISYVSLGKYLKAKKFIKEGSRDNRIAVIVSEGEIVDGEGNAGQIGSDDFIKEIRKAGKNKNIKAIVLRINSPGGSASASDNMWREIQLTRKIKPVIASMGDVAASGGYYMAMGTDTIVAHPTTITGSIGIFGLWFNTQKLLNDKIGVTFDGIKTHEYANSPSLTREMSASEKQVIQNRINEGYETFTSKAAQGRKMDLEKLKSVAGGRVWSGEQALSHGLVDVLGDLDDAIKIAAAKANLEDEEYQVRYFPFPKSDIEKMIEKISKKGDEARITKYLGEYAPIYKQLKSMENRDIMQARIPYDVSFK